MGLIMNEPVTLPMTQLCRERMEVLIKKGRFDPFADVDEVRVCGPLETVTL